jgi:hypothetical protein
VERFIHLKNIPIWTECPVCLSGYPKLVASVGPVVGAVVGAWLHARYGRKVRLKIGDVEAEAQTVEQVEELLSRAEEFQEQTRRAIVREP